MCDGQQSNGHRDGHDMVTTTATAWQQGSKSPPTAGQAVAQWGKPWPSPGGKKAHPAGSVPSACRQRAVNLPASPCGNDQQSDGHGDGQRSMQRPNVQRSRRRSMRRSARRTCPTEGTVFMQMGGGLMCNGQRPNVNCKTWNQR
eukprot:gene11960-biopygen6414